jgi:hypothetical protein
MADSLIEQAYAELFQWCRELDFAGHDPFDALNSGLFQATPFKHSRLARLAWTQLLKRSPVNLRSLALVPHEKNAKGIALFALAALADYRRTRTKEAEACARELLDQLQAMQLSSWSGAAWGYNFDWQSRVLFAPKGTPTIVPTAFAARAMVEASEAFQDGIYLKTARSVCDFIIHDLQRSVETDTELCFSYSPSSNTTVYNASLLAAETLSSVASFTGESGLSETAMRATRYVIRQQRDDGSWTYGAVPAQSWIDNLHTAFLLSSLSRIIRYASTAQTDELNESLRRGYGFWRERFFLADGWPKYYDDTPYPADAHAAATAIATLSDLKQLDLNALALAKKVGEWSIENLRDRRGFFYYQRRRFYRVRTPFMRWSEAWMLYGLSRLLEELSKEGESGKG